MAVYADKIEPQTYLSLRLGRTIGEKPIRITVQKNGFCSLSILHDGPVTVAELKEAVEAAEKFVANPEADV
jgi:hypothetical protein